jgi:hypothetical protein
MDLKNIFGEVIFSAAVETIAELVSRAVAAKTNLFRANLSLADLVGADLSHADLSHASLSGADLSGAYLYGANLSGANLPPPTAVLLASWGDVSEQLCADLMEFDCWSHGDRKAFDYFASHGKCPYTGHLEERAARFLESGEIWKKDIGKLCSPRDLMLRLFVEKKIKR